MYYFNFTIPNFSTSQVTGAETGPRTCERTLISTLQTGLTAAAFTCSAVKPENQAPQFGALKNGTTYHIGGQFNTEANFCRVIVFVKHKRSLTEKLLGLNKLAPQNYIEKTLREMIRALPDVSDLQESQSFGEIEVENGTFVEIWR
ncbi:hypothetical protein [Parasedimentitalea psychrophila]|uniref:Uncharacterized protein n=1 Tax=Parasedimentitalea psychrophila TaxID=2997337 RepID=A0A9Y2P5T8_9RHOB|nr:hypothetical protein [Parasedimentitalea psychrophila]WIY26714.1 hypothetical protein QPJ95_07290 [Parasedimentitalea psychrophila]